MTITTAVDMVQTTVISPSMDQVEQNREIATRHRESIEKTIQARWRGDKMLPINTDTTAVPNGLFTLLTFSTRP